MKREMLIVPYNYRWNERYNEIKDFLYTVFEEIVVDIQHFGSTAIEGMPSKPIIDVLVIVSDISKVDNYNEKMINAGYVARGENGISGRRYFQKLASDGVNHLEHIHIYELDNPHVKDELMFRDYLIMNREAFEKYKKAKLELSDKYRFSPSEYTENKSKCVNEILVKARELN